MAEPKFSPTPWSAEIAPSGVSFRIWDSSNRYIIASDRYQGKRSLPASCRTEKTANALVLAAAPDTYRALETCVKTLEALLRLNAPHTAEIEAAIQKGRAALEKAERG